MEIEASLTSEDTERAASATHPTNRELVGVPPMTVTAFHELDAGTPSGSSLGVDVGRGSLGVFATVPGGVLYPRRRTEKLPRDPPTDSVLHYGVECVGVIEDCNGGGTGKGLFRGEISESSRRSLRLRRWALLFRVHKVCRKAGRVRECPLRGLPTDGGPVWWGHRFTQSQRR